MKCSKRASNRPDTGEDFQPQAVRQCCVPTIISILKESQEMYDIPAITCRTDQTIKRSRFIATVAHAPDEQGAKTVISAVKNEFPDASHHCWAYVAGPPGDTARVGMNDDGEPRGTAGKPILTVLLHSQIGEIVAVVTRYFGGTKLGKGGLVRAYSGAVKHALAELAVKEKRDLLPFTIVSDYPKAATVKQIIKSFDAEITQEKYETEVFFEIKLPKKAQDLFVRTITDMTGGEIRIRTGIVDDMRMQQI